MKNKDKYHWLSGVVTPLVTPLTKEERLDLPALERLVKKQIESKVQGLFVLGSVGEGPLLLSSVRKEVVRQILFLSRNKVVVLVGVMDNSVTLVLEKLKKLEGLGVSGGVVTLPYYGWTGSNREAIDFFLTLADKSPLPIIVYNLSRVVHKEIGLEVVEHLFGHPNIAGIKDSNADNQEMKQILRSPKKPPTFKVLIGNSFFAGEMLFEGAAGIVSVHSNFMPELIVDIYISTQRKDRKRVNHLQELILELQKVLKCPNTVGGVKCALEILGVCSRRTVRSWPQADEEDNREITGILTTVRKRYSTRLV